MNLRLGTIAAVAALAVLGAACGSSDDETTTATATTTTTEASSTASTSAQADGITNEWLANDLDPTKLPIGDGKASTTTAAVGTVFACQMGNPSAPGATADGPWIDAANNTWDSTTKLAVEGDVEWPTAEYSETIDGDTRVLMSNGIPVGVVTGNFPIAETDPSYQYDHNPGRVQEAATTLRLPTTPTVAATPTCVAFDAVGMLRNGVALFNALDGRGDDAVAHESQDVCNGHPNQEKYHYHSVPNCLLNAATGASSVVGFALDGFPIVVERDAAGALPTNADLDECHGRTSLIELNGEVVEMYHYSATFEYPYTIGCYRGTPTAA